MNLALELGSGYVSVMMNPGWDGIGHDHLYH